jgi:hypothetical protein
MNLADLLLGRPLATEDENAQRIGPVKGIPIFGLDALSSAAYGPEAALTLLIPLGMAGIAYILPISISIVVLLGIVYFSYRQTIEAYPQGGGSYTVAKLAKILECRRGCLRQLRSWLIMSSLRPSESPRGWGHSSQLFLRCSDTHCSCV